MRWITHGCASIGIAGVLACGGARDAGDTNPSDSDQADAGDESGAQGSGGETTTAGTRGADGETGTAGGDEDGELAFEQLAGLWVGPVDSNTSVGDFPTMNMDLRVVDERVMFSRVDLDADNSLRFAFAFEQEQGQTALIFRNGGEFVGVLRDTRTELVEYDPQERRWRFCAMQGGCAYVEATFTFPEPDRLLLDVDVMGMMHFDWPARRVEARPLPGSFAPRDEVGTLEDPFPPMPRLTVSLSWSEPLNEATSVWVLLSTQPCATMPTSCHPSRFLSAMAPAGATEAELTFEQIHPGSYRANAILDRNGNLAGTFLPDTGDSIAIPDQAIEIDENGENTASFVLSVDL